MPSIELLAVAGESLIHIAIDTVIIWVYALDDSVRGAGVRCEGEAWVRGVGERYRMRRDASSGAS
ncbi:oligopeptide transporter [Moniliophthora roreri]|nr:oligopeptide transporter [Moniliophthora roreri]